MINFENVWKVEKLELNLKQPGDETGVKQKFDFLRDYQRNGIDSLVT